MDTQNAPPITEIKAHLNEVKKNIYDLQQECQILFRWKRPSSAYIACQPYLEAIAIRRQEEMFSKLDLVLASTHAFAVLALRRAGTRTGRDLHVLPVSDHFPLRILHTNGMRYSLLCNARKSGTKLTLGYGHASGNKPFAFLDLPLDGEPHLIMRGSYVVPCRTVEQAESWVFDTAGSNCRILRPDQDTARFYIPSGSS